MKSRLVSILDSGSLSEATYDAVVVGVYGRTLTEAGVIIDEAFQGSIGLSLNHHEFPTQISGVLVLNQVLKGDLKRVVVVQMGEALKLSVRDFNRCAIAAAQAVSGCEQLLWCLSEQDGEGDLAGLSMLALRDVNYQFSQFKGEINPPKKFQVFTQFIPVKSAAIDQHIARACAVADGVDMCRDLGNLPPNICTPQYLADTALLLGEHSGVVVDVLDKQQLLELKMNAFLAVASGSIHPPKLIVVKIERGTVDQAPIVLVGKGVTFDAGGISIKPSDAMDEMKYDMCGAASVLGTLQATIAMGLPLNVIGVIPVCENMPSGSAFRPSDIIRAANGTTIEVINTDAEGRLLLCDALTYVERFNPCAVIDIATLTGACIVALGGVHSGLFAREDVLARSLVSAANSSGDSVWRMPLDADYDSALNSAFADVRNEGGRPAGSITAARFLERFTRAYPWAHLDVAGTASLRGSQMKGATGRPVRLLTRYLQDFADMQGLGAA
ncbi:leucyl aminopeptidase [Pseudomonas putida]|uniref:leucyl aminopeptidase n=1 Tax=Pseudomonas putida TaxID=303 RepID=UPI0009A226FF|nr:leucyl aminopeptidase [Pseudomonas putida]